MCDELQLFVLDSRVMFGCDSDWFVFHYSAFSFQSPAVTKPRSKQIFKDRKDQFVQVM